MIFLSMTYQAYCYEEAWVDKQSPPDNLDNIIVFDILELLLLKYFNSLSLYLICKIFLF